jgi:hypothetical protein
MEIRFTARQYRMSFARSVLHPTASRDDYGDLTCDMSKHEIYLANMPSLLPYARFHTFVATTLEHGRRR